MQNSSIERSFIGLFKSRQLFRMIIVKPYKNQKLMKNLECCVDFSTTHHPLCFLCFRMSSLLWDCLPSFGLFSYYSSLSLRNSILFWTHMILSSLIELVSFAEIFFYHCHHLTVHIHLPSFEFQIKFVIIIVLSALGCMICSNRRYRRVFLQFYATILSGIL